MEPQIGDIWRFENGFYCYHLLILDIHNMRETVLECTSISLEYGYTGKGTFHYTSECWKKVA